MNKLDVNGILDIQLNKVDIGPITIKGYLHKLLSTLWNKEEGFSGKRPFGNSGWKLDIFYGLVEQSVIKGQIDDDGFLESCDDKAGDTIISSCIEALFEETPLVYPIKLIPDSVAGAYTVLFPNIPEAITEIRGEDKDNECILDCLETAFEIYEELDEPFPCPNFDEVPGSFAIHVPKDLSVRIYEHNAFYLR